MFQEFLIVHLHYYIRFRITQFTLYSHHSHHLGTLPRTHCLMSNCQHIFCKTLALHTISDPNHSMYKVLLNATGEHLMRQIRLRVSIVPVTPHDWTSINVLEHCTLIHGQIDTPMSCFHSANTFCQKIVFRKIPQIWYNFSKIIVVIEIIDICNNTKFVFEVFPDELWSC